MSKAGKRLIEGAEEALAVARGEKPAASIYVNGYRYVPAEAVTVERERAAAFAYAKHDWPARWIAASLRGENDAYAEFTPSPQIEG